jgi:hypothetical protein
LARAFAAAFSQPVLSESSIARDVPGRFGETCPPAHSG